MKVNIENASLRGDNNTRAWVLETLVTNLKELRDRTQQGDMNALNEFFEIFKFNDSERPTP